MATKHTPLKAEPNPVYKTADSLEDAWLEIKANLPLTDVNQTFALLMQFQNTLLKELQSHGN
ncbi:hypothetical protein Presley_30 [Acinetobacter phage Presley]|uniref:Uncharacterized protein n=1 Tax=Acinetobacter phage Presley TaxID=1406780 RepID=U5PZM9_9CAUD|nr:hypothetical protein Presley_30 [Acinetobacter phage Presley]AGY48097.1 hypothetical protein Presley_30 [Acinetobacter phage Presley]